MEWVQDWVQDLKNIETKFKNEREKIMYYEEKFKSITDIDFFAIVMTKALEGELRSPFYAFRPLNKMSEVDTIDEYGYILIVQMNKLGFITDDSQVGKGRPFIDKDNDIQRSYVSGFLPKKYITKGLHFKNFLCIRTPLLEKEKSGKYSYSRIPLTGCFTNLPIKMNSDIHFLAEDLSEELWKKMIEKYDYVFMCDPVWGKRADGQNGLFTQIILHLQSLQ